jgi:ectoine hydroxylase-related dioxygenase (phytanoyl-CoA dioxygenase family)
MALDAARAQLQELGFLILRNVIPPVDCERIARRLVAPEEGRAGSRALLEQHWCRELAEALSQHPEIASLLSNASVAVQCTLFEKSRENNWLVAFHQDQSIPVAAPTVCTGGSRKDGLTFVQPPAEVLEQMLAVRLQIDAPDGVEGALRVIPGSHRSGKLTRAEIAGFRSAQSEVSCEVEQGGVLVMRPLLLHASSKILGTQPRRVLHFLFGPRT